MTTPPPVRAAVRGFSSRRDFLVKVAQYGGSVIAGMSALDLLAQDNGSTWLPKDLPRLNQARTVAIIGAGAGGLCAAHELTKLGYSVRVLEGRHRPGGRIWTVRRGTKETDLNGFTQVCTFDDGHYYNAGPARIPQHHYTTLGYCREFGVALEVFNNWNESAYLHQSATNLKRRIREARADYEGYTAELLAKALSTEQLDAPLSKEDKAKLFEYFRATAGLDKNLRYGATPSRGYTEWPAGPGQPGVLTKPDELKTVIDSGFARHFANSRNITQQAVMFQPVGGIDQLPYAMAKVLDGVITYGAEVTALKKLPDGRARVEYAIDGGAAQAIEADYCICSLPATILKDLPGDFSPQVREMAKNLPYGTSSKIGLQMKRRFWEEDDWIYGGGSYTDQPIRQIWYPNHGYLGKKGVILGYYAGDSAEEGGVNITRMSPAQRVEFALACGEKFHAQYRPEFETAFSNSWQATRFSHGALVRYTSAEERTRALDVLGAADGPIYYVGEHVSWLSGWIAGAFESALRAVSLVHKRTLA